VLPVFELNTIEGLKTEIGYFEFTINNFHKFKKSAKRFQVQVIVECSFIVRLVVLC
jgi:hypothetical protein